MDRLYLPDLREGVTALALMGAMVLAAWIGRRQVLGVIVLALLSFVWLTVDKLWELQVLVKFVDTAQERHGLTLADLWGFLGLAVVSVQAVMLWLRRRREIAGRHTRGS